MPENTAMHDLPMLNLFQFTAGGHCVGAEQAAALADADGACVGCQPARPSHLCALLFGAALHHRQQVQHQRAHWYTATAAFPPLLLGVNLATWQRQRLANGCFR